jgi:hypothetical protein
LLKWFQLITTSTRQRLREDRSGTRDSADLRGRVSKILYQLRALAPSELRDADETIRLAGDQARDLLAALKLDEPPILESSIVAVLDINIDRFCPYPASGDVIEWRLGAWAILINSCEPRLRQRFTLAHQLKHVLDKPLEPDLYRKFGSTEALRQRERAADHFAAEVLMPRAWVECAWRAGSRSIPVLAKTFEVSYSAMQVRLWVLGLTKPRRCLASSDARSSAQRVSREITSPINWRDCGTAHRIG